MRRQNLFGILLGITLVALMAVLPAFAGDKVEVVETESGFYYTVQKGDTLWDLSQRFSDSPWQWPDLWKENDQLPNPHLIYPGDRIRLYLKKDLEKYAPEPKVEKVIKQDPRLPPPYFFYSKIDQAGFLKMQSMEASGTIFKIQGDQFKTLVEQGDTVYIKPGMKSTFNRGDQFTVYKIKKPLSRPGDPTKTPDQFYLLGVLEITEMKEGFALGKIVESYREIKMGDLLMPYVARSPKIPLGVSPYNMRGSIIAAEETRHLIGPDQLVFIDKGRSHGIEPGQMYSITYEEKGKLDPKDKEEVVLQEIFFGDMIILLAENQTATALVTRSKDSIKIGTTFRAPK